MCLSAFVIMPDNRKWMPKPYMLVVLGQSLNLVVGGKRYSKSGALSQLSPAEDEHIKNSTRILDIIICKDVTGISVSYTHLTLPTNREV